MRWVSERPCPSKAVGPTPECLLTYPGVPCIYSYSYVLACSHMRARTHTHFSAPPNTLPPAKQTNKQSTEWQGATLPFQIFSVSFFPFRCSEIWLQASQETLLDLDANHKLSLMSHRVNAGQRPPLPTLQMEVLFTSYGNERKKACFMGWGETTKGHGTGRFWFLFAIFPFPRKFLEVKYAVSSNHTLG